MITKKIIVIKTKTTITIIIVVNNNVIFVNVHNYICPDSCIPQI